MELYNAALPYAMKSASLVKEFDEEARVGTSRSYQDPLDARKAHGRMKAECYLMSQGENDLSEIRTAPFEEIHA